MLFVFCSRAHGLERRGVEDLQKDKEEKKITGRGEWSVDIVGSKGVWAAYEVVGKVGEQGGMWYMHGFATDRLSKLRRVRAC